MTLQLEQVTILVLDDDNFVVSSISNILDQLAVARVVTAGNVETGLRVIEELDGEIHAALVDFQMPERHGLQFIKEVRTHATRAPYDLPSLMLTNHVHPRLLGLAMALDVDAFLEKPAKISALKDHLGRVLTEPHPKGSPQDYARIDVDRSLEALVRDLSQSDSSLPKEVTDVNGRVVDLAKDDPPIGETLAADLVNGKGQILLPAGTLLDAGNITLLKNLMEFDPSLGIIRV